MYAATHHYCNRNDGPSELLSGASSSSIQSGLTRRTVLLASLPPSEASLDEDARFFICRTRLCMARAESGFSESTPCPGYRGVDHTPYLFDSLRRGLQNAVQKT
jgi:hypothetical protein